MVDGPEVWADRGLVGARAYPDEGDGGGEERVEGRVGVFAESEVASDARASLGGPASVAALEGVLHDSAHRLRRGRREGVDGGGEVSARGERGGDGREEGGAHLLIARRVEGREPRRVDAHGRDRCPW